MACSRIWLDPHCSRALVVDILVVSNLKSSTGKQGISYMCIFEEFLWDKGYMHVFVLPAIAEWHQTTLPSNMSRAPSPLHQGIIKVFICQPGDEKQWDNTVSFVSFCLLSLVRLNISSKLFESLFAFLPLWILFAQILNPSFFKAELFLFMEALYMLKRILCDVTVICSNSMSIFSLWLWYFLTAVSCLSSWIYQYFLL